MTQTARYKAHDEANECGIGDRVRITVSYTHLDVYKRQAFRRAMRKAQQTAMRSGALGCLLYTSRCV